MDRQMKLMLAIFFGASVGIAIPLAKDARRTQLIEEEIRNLEKETEKFNVEIRDVWIAEGIIKERIRLGFYDDYDDPYEMAETDFVFTRIQLAEERYLEQGD